jgi:hypothetical protein
VFVLEFSLLFFLWKMLPMKKDPISLVQAAQRQLGAVPHVLAISGLSR